MTVTASVCYRFLTESSVKNSKIVKNRETYENIIVKNNKKFSVWVIEKGKKWIQVRE